MIKKFPLPNFKLLLFISALFTFSNAFSANWYVNDNSTTGDVYCSAVGNDTNNGTSPSTPKLTLNAAYAAAVAGDVIYVDKGTFTGAGNRALIFNKAIKIIGAGSSNTIFTSHTDHRFATISANNVSIQSLQLFDFFLAGTTGIGQVILVNSNITGFELTNVVVKNNYGDSSNGESIYLSSGSSATFNGLFFSCSGFNGSSGGAVKVDNATLVLKNSVFSQSRNSDGFGGAIQMLGTNPNVNIDKTTFIGNSAKAGGAISQIKGVLVVTNSCFNRNYCQGDSSGNTNGGGHYYSTGTITSATFTNCKFEGAFFCASTNPTEYPCQFSSNISNDGNAISIRGAAGNFTFDTCDFNNSNQPNANFDNGLDFYLDKSGVISVNINNCKFANDMWGGTGTGGSDAVNIWNEDLTSAEFIVTNSGTKQTTANQDGTYGNNYSYAVSTGGAPSGNDLTQSSSTTVTCISGFAGCTTVVNCATETNAPIIISCAPDQTLSSCSGTLPDYRPLLSVFDDCSVTIVQSPAPGTLLSSLGNGTHIITFTVSDQSPNSPDATCSMNLTLSGCNSCSAALSYPNSSVCKTATTQTPTFSPAGGAFTSTSGLTINASTGVITPSTSTAGTYTITYTPNSADPICTATFTITIVGDPNSGNNGTLTICAGTTVTASQLFAALGGSPASGGTWSPALAGAGTYTYTVGATSPCTTAATATVTVSDSQPVQPTIACYQTATFNTSTCSWDVTGTQPTQPTATNCWDNYQFNTTSCSWVNNGTQPTQPTATNCWDNYQFNTTSCSWVNNGTQPTQPTATNCWDNYQFNTTSCSWVNNGSQPTQPTATNCWDNYQFNTTSCTWVNNGTQPTQPTATNCWDNYQFNTTSCSWVNNGSQPTQPTATNCWDNYQFNTTSCTWVNNGTQPTQPTATNCWDNYQFNTTSCSWVNNGTQPTQPTATNCWDNYQFNTTSCTWVNNGTQPTQPTATNCWDNYQFNTTSCSWVNNGSQPTQPTATNCWDNYQFNTTSCTWVNNGTQPTQPTATNCWDNYQFNTTSCSWVNNGTQPTQPTATNCWDNYQFNTTSCSWVNNGSQPTQPTATNCWDNYQFNTTSCTWVNNGTQPTQPTATNCWDNYQFNTISCSWVNNGSQPTQPTATNCWDNYQFNTTSCSWVNNGTQPTQPTATNCWDNYQFNTTSCSWVNNGTQPTQPTATNCWDNYQFNTTSCSWVNNGTQPTQPTATNCWDNYQFNTTSCSWVNNGSQPTQPTATNCWDNYQFNTTSCSWVNNGTQPTQPTATNCWDNYQFNTTSCSWVNNGSQPTQPTATNCWDNYQFNTTSCSWVNNGTQPTQPTATNCWDNYQFNTTSCSWVNNGTQPTQPTATNCWDNYQFNTTSCTWVNNGTQPTQPTATNCWDNYQFNTTSCSWVNNGTQPTQPTATNCWDNYQFNTTSCSWVNNGTQPTQPTATNCWDNYQFNTTSCTWVNNGTQPTQPTATNCWDNYQFNTTSCTWVNNGTQPTQPTATNCWDNYQFNTTSCSWVNNGTQPTQPTATNCWDNYQFNTTSCSWVNNGTQPTQPTATNCWDNYQFNTTSCSWVNNGTQPTQPTATNCWDNYQFNTTSCSWVNNGTQPTQPTATNCWDNYQFNTTSCSWVNNGTQPTQPTATNCWDNYQFNTTSCSWVNNGTQPTQPTATNCWDNYQFNTTSCTWVNNGTQPTQPLLIVNNAICNGTSYSVSFNSSGNVTASTGTISGNTVSGIPVGTNVILTATSSSFCSAITRINVTSPSNCTNPPIDCIVPSLNVGQGACSGNGTFSFAFNASVGAVITASSGTISGNTVTGIAVGTNVTITATNGSCATSIIVNSPTDCATPCATPMLSLSAGICNGSTYSVNISNPNNATIIASAGTVTATSINNIQVGTSVTITATITGCTPQIITISSPLIPINPDAGNDGNLEICEGITPSSSQLFGALGGNPQSGGSWSNSGNIYTYTVLAASSCASLPLDRATVTVSTIIINDFEIIGHCNDSRYQLTINPVQSDAIYSWYNGIGDLVGTGNSMFINSSDTYEVKSSKSMCSKIKSIYIENIHCIIPKGVSPNGDGLNDTWDLSNLNVEKAQIFNRYGMEMYSKSNYTDEWHGQTNEGQMLPSATYYYVLRFLDGTSKTGWVYLNREQ